MLYEAVVTEVLPKVGGVRVRFRDLVPSGFGINDYVRVLCRRMSTQGGAALDLPELGEHGVVGRLAGGTCVWLGATPFLDQNQVDPTEGIAYDRHRSGVVFQERDNGDFEIAHPSGLRFTVSADGAALPSLQATSRPLPRGGGVPTVNISHPSGTTVSISAAGSLTGTVVGDIDLIGSEDLNAQVGGNAVVAAGVKITLSAPVIAFLGEILLNGIVMPAEGIPGPAGPTGPTGPTGPGGSDTGGGGGGGGGDH